VHRLPREGVFNEQLFDQTWTQLSQRSVSIGSDQPVIAAAGPTRVERSCIWNETDFRNVFTGITQGDNFNPFCSITCPDGVAIDGEASASIPRLAGGDFAIFEGVSFTQGTGQQTMTIFVESSIAVDVVFDRFIGFDDEGFTNLEYVIEAAAVCL